MVHFELSCSDFRMIDYSGIHFDSTYMIVYCRDRTVIEHNLFNASSSHLNRPG